MRRRVTFVLLAFPLVSMPAVGQFEPPRSGAFARLGAGLGTAQAHATGGLGDRKVGPLGDLQLGTGGQRVQFVLEVHARSFRFRVPLSVFGDDTLRVQYLFAGLQWFLDRQVYIRASLGSARGKWSGLASTELTDGAGNRVSGPAIEGRTEGYPAAGLALGLEARTFGRWLDYEVWWRGATALCFESCAFSGERLVGIHVLVPFY